MLRWIIKIIAAIIVWVAVAFLATFLGGLLATVQSQPILLLGSALAQGAQFIGFLAGAVYLFWGPFPYNPAVRGV